MVKKVVLLVFIVSVFVLTSCSCGGRMLVSSEDKKADARMEQILSAIKDQDRKTIKELFSKQAVNESNDFDSGIDYLLSFQGRKSWERINGLLENQ